MNAVTSIYCPIETMEKFNQFAEKEKLSKGKALSKLIDFYEEKREKETVKNVQYFGIICLTI